MASALIRGRTLDPEAVAMANQWRENRIKELLSRDRLSLSFKERHEAQRITGRWDFWNHGKEGVVNG